MVDHSGWSSNRWAAEFLKDQAELGSDGHEITWAEGYFRLARTSAQLDLLAALGIRDWVYPDIDPNRGACLHPEQDTCMDGTECECGAIRAQRRLPLVLGAIPGKFVVDPPVTNHGYVRAVPSMGAGGSIGPWSAPADVPVVDLSKPRGGTGGFSPPQSIRRSRLAKLTTATKKALLADLANDDAVLNQLLEFALDLP